MNIMRDVTCSPEYDIQFWNAMRGHRGKEEILSEGRILATNSYALPVGSSKKITEAINKESVFRSLATVINGKW